MKEKQKERKWEWRRLDNSAKIFPISTGKKYSSVFRLSVVLTENIQPKALKQAVSQALAKYESFRVRMRNGFFWNYLEYNPKEPIVEQEKDYPCQYINPRTNHDYLFKVTYFDQKINIDIFHSLTDGNSGTNFFKEIIYHYLEITHPEDFNEEIRGNRKIEYSIEDSYLKNYDKKAKGNASSAKAYRLKGKKLALGAVSAIHEIIDLEQLKKVSKEEGATVTQYLTAILIYVIYQENYLKNKGKKPIKICIPVNLKKYFPSNTISNFFSYITVIAQMEKQGLTDFNKILAFVKEEFKERLTPEEIGKTMSSNVKLGINPFIKMIPLFIKKPLVRLSYVEIRKYTTTTFSNIGRIGIIGKYQKYIQEFLMLIAPEPVEKIKCAACSFENKMVMTFTSVLKEGNIEKGFYEFLSQKGIPIQIESNGVIDVISTETNQQKK